MKNKNLRGFNIFLQDDSTPEQRERFKQLTCMRENFSNDLDIIVLCETWLKPDLSLAYVNVGSPS